MGYKCGVEPAANLEFPIPCCKSQAQLRGFGNVEGKLMASQIIVFPGEDQSAGAHPSKELIEFVGRSMDVTERKCAEDELKAALEEIKQLRDQLYRDNLALRDEVDRASMFEEIVG